MDDRGRWGRRALVTVPLIVGIGLLIGRLSDSGRDDFWFDALVAPAFMPPGWAFGAAWTFLYVLLGIVLAMILAGQPRRNGLVALFGAQMVLNFSWSPVFFELHLMRIGLALIVVIFLVTLVLAARLWTIRRAAALLLVPYLLWLAFAAALNLGFIRLNPEQLAHLGPTDLHASPERTISRS